MTEFFGRPINGEVTHYSNTPRAQRAAEELLEAIDAVLAFDEVEAVTWRQYTPYFNDGDACVFSAYGTGIVPAGLTEEQKEWLENYSDYGDLSLDPWAITYYGEQGELPFTISEGVTEALTTLANAIEGGAHDVTLNKYFGDPAEVRATREGFEVEYYEHD